MATIDGIDKGCPHTPYRVDQALLGRPGQPRHRGHQPLSVELDLPERLSRDELCEEEGETRCF